MSAYRTASSRDTPRILVIHGRRSLKPVLALVFLAPFLVMLSRTTLHCSRSQNLCIYETEGLLSGRGRVMLSQVSNIRGEEDRGMMRPVFVLRDGSKLPLSPQNDSLLIAEKGAFMNEFRTWRMTNDAADVLDAGYGPSPGCLLVIAAVLVGLVVFVAKSRQRAVIVYDPVADTTDVTFYPGYANPPRRTRLEHARLAATTMRLFDERGQSVDLPRGTSRHAIETIRDLLDAGVSDV